VLRCYVSKWCKLSFWGVSLNTAAPAAHGLSDWSPPLTVRHHRPLAARTNWISSGPKIILRDLA